MSKAGMARRRAYALVMTLEMALIGAGLGLVAGCGVNLGGAPAGTGIAARLGADFVDIDAVPPNLTQPVPAVGAATGSYTWDCGRNENGHRNTVNVVSAPGYPGPAHHVHDYVGNLSTMSTPPSRAWPTARPVAATATCRRTSGRCCAWSTKNPPMGTTARPAGTTARPAGTTD
ncbi:hypothetical protein [Verrucosispora sp. ts21]|uniref:hypothetical protein n=1 Tax=Verrucosispora sp. ts21 TaxID=2069341 RepID=UPI001E3D5FB1|nr:hypothetical protein [Verrucosispora sp. ts21]